jgi:hypothetical protein
VRLAIEPLEERAVPAATFTVTNLNDSGAGSLRQALADANVTPGADTILFQPGLSGTITLTTGELHISDSLTITGPGAGAITVSGNNASRVFNIDDGTTALSNVKISGLTISTGNVALISQSGGGILNNETLTLTACSLSDNSAFTGAGLWNTVGSTAILTDCTLSDNSATRDSGGILNTGTVILTNCTLFGNEAGNTAGDSGGGILSNGTAILTNCTVARNSAFQSGEGGGIFNGSSGTLMLTNCSVLGNLVPDGDGGGIFNSSGGTVTLSNCTLLDNSVGNGKGGGICNVGVTTLTNCTLSGNSAFEGGGLCNDNGGTATLSNCTVSGNSVADGDGAGLFNNHTGTAILSNCTLSGNSAFQNGEGGGLFNDGAAFLTNCTVSGNSAFEGGGICCNEGTATIRNSTIAFNTANPGGGANLGGGIFVSNVAAATLQSSIVADNSVQAPGNGPDLWGEVTATFSLIENTAGTIFDTGSANNLTSVDPLLGPLQFNGGPTPTHALLPGSPAINHGANPGGLTSDQRGFPFLRASGAAPDIGAFEFQSNPGPTAQAIQAAVQAVQALQRAGARLAAFAFGDVNGDFVNDIVLAFRQRNNKLLIATFDGIDGHIRGVLQPFTSPLRTDAKVHLVLMDVSADPGAEIVLLVTSAPGVPRLSVFTEGGRRVV